MRQLATSALEWGPSGQGRFAKCALVSEIGDGLNFRSASPGNSARPQFRVGGRPSWRLFYTLLRALPARSGERTWSGDPL